MNTSKKPLSRMSAKRLSEIKSGAKMQGTFKAKAGAPMSRKVVDTVFGKKRKPLRGRNPTGEAKVFAEIWEQRPHECEVCRATITEAMAGNFSHILPKGSYRSLRLDPRNIVLKCLACHDRWHQHGAVGLRYSFMWRKVIALHDELKTECHQRLNDELSGRK